MVRAPTWHIRPTLTLRLEMAKEREEMAEAEASVAGVKKQLAAAKAKLADLERDTDHYTAIVSDWQQGASQDIAVELY